MRTAVMIAISVGPLIALGLSYALPRVQPSVWPYAFTLLLLNLGLMGLQIWLKQRSTARDSMQVAEPKPSNDPVVLAQLAAESAKPTEVKESQFCDSWSEYNLTVEDTKADIGQDGMLTYPRKIRAFIKNASSQEIEVWDPLWDRSSEVLAQIPLGVGRLRLEGPKGWRAGDWKDSVASVRVPVNAVFECWVGLLQPTGDGIERRRGFQRNGILVLPIKLGNRLVLAKVKV